MRIVRGLQSFPPEAGRGVAALGAFDGIHLGHRAILGTAVERDDRVVDRKVVGPATLRADLARPGEAHAADKQRADQNDGHRAGRRVEDVEAAPVALAPDDPFGMRRHDLSVDAEDGTLRGHV